MLVVSAAAITSRHSSSETHAAALLPSPTVVPSPSPLPQTHHTDPETNTTRLGNWSGVPRKPWRDIEPMPCGLLYFVHIPKTGGSTVFNRLKGITGWGFNRLYWGDDRKEEDKWVKHRDRWIKSPGWEWLQEQLKLDKPSLIVEAHHGAPGLQYMEKHALKKIACQLKAKGCQLRIVTMLREPVSRLMSGLIFNTAWESGIPEKEAALRFIGENSELQSRYLLEGHPRQWRDALWRKLPSPHTVDDDLVEGAQEALAHAYLVGHSAELNSFVYAIYRLLGLRHRKAAILLRHHDDDSNVTPQYNRSALSTDIRTAVHVATQSDRQVYESWFSGGERPKPFTEMCRHGPGPPGWARVGGEGITECPAGQHNADASQCLAAIREALPKMSFPLVKMVNKGVSTGIPHGCMYSKPSQMAMFNANTGPPGVPHNDNYQLICST